MNKQETQKQYDEVQAELVKLKAIIDASDKAESWPQEGDAVYILYPDGVIVPAPFDGSNSQLHALAMGALYRTEEEAEAARDKQLATVRVQNKLKELQGDEELDWSDLGQEKHYIFYDHITQCLAVNFDARHQRPTLYSTEEACLWVIENMEADVKLMLGVE